MNKKDKRFYLVFMLVMTVAAVVGLLVGWFVVRPARSQQATLPNNPKVEQLPMSIGDNKIMVEVRDDDEGRSLGLSGRKSLADGEGMVFVFDGLSQPLFWMKDMLVDLDVIWIKDGVIMQIDENVPAPTEDKPKAETMVPAMPVDMVLEVPAGWVMEEGVQLGDKAMVDDR